MNRTAARNSIVIAFHNVDDTDAAIRAVGTALEILADQTERDEPYATRSIEELRAAANRVFDLIHTMESDQ